MNCNGECGLNNTREKDRVDKNVAGEMALQCRTSTASFACGRRWRRGWRFLNRRYSD